MNTTHPRVVSHLYVNKKPYVDPNNPDPPATLAYKVSPITRSPVRKEELPKRE